MPSAAAPRLTADTLFALAGGEAGLRRLTDAFYARVAEEPLLAPLFSSTRPAALEHRSTLLARFLVELCGGPADYSERLGQPRMRARHGNVRIGVPQRDAWVATMTAALADAGIAEPARTTLQQFFEIAASELVNQGAPPPPPEPAQALTRPILTRWQGTSAAEALLDAISAGDVPRVEALLPDATATPAELIEHAANRDQPGVVRLLLARGFTSSPGQSPSFHTAHRQLSDLFCAYAAVRRLQRRHPTMDDVLSDLEHVVRERLTAALRQEPALLTARNWLGHTLLHVAAGTGDDLLVSWLLRLGADPRAEAEIEHTPLAALANRTIHRAADSAEDGCATAALLLGAGAGVNARSGAERQTPLHMAARRGNVALGRFLLAHGADLAARSTRGETPLHRAASCNQPAFVALLLEHGADPLATDRKGHTPRDAARSVAVAALLAAA
jgi:truncated hemoglobin YjbI/ankyrin repeat protein